MGRLDRAGWGTPSSTRATTEALGEQTISSTSSSSDPSPSIALLVSAAETGLPAMLKDDGLFCYNLARGDAAPRGESVRYTLITLLGLLRRNACGLPPIAPLGPIQAAVDAHADGMGVGDAGLALWAQVRQDPEKAVSNLTILQRQTKLQPLEELPGLEVAWWVIAAAEACAAGLPADDELTRAISTFTARRSGKTPLFRHTGAGWRAQFPNFATEIYSLLALTHLARHGYLPQAEGWALELGDALLTLQRRDGGWPWLYHADQGAVVEPYEIYSVHQDAMAPMALFALTDLTGRLEYAQAALDGIPWCFGQNDLGVVVVDSEQGFIDRSIRRRGAARRVNLYGNTTLSATLGRKARVDIGTLEVNRTCRSYHLGWILEAWSGRDELVNEARGAMQ